MMTSSSSGLKSRVTDIVTCPICMDLFDNPKSLPCLHAFCLKCLERQFRDRSPGDEVPCPVCRREFVIPKNGLRDGLVHHFFIQTLVDAKKACGETDADVPCEACSEDNDADKVPSSTGYCVDCNQKLCEPCCRRHRKMRTGAHKVIPLGSETESELVKARGDKCEKHSSDEVRLYCFDCKTNICLMCAAVEHRQHRCQDIREVAQECLKQIDEDLVPVIERKDGACLELTSLDDEIAKFQRMVKEAKMKIVHKVGELKRIIDIDSQAKVLEGELQKLLTGTCMEITSRKERVEQAIRDMEDFRAYCLELKSKGKPSDLTRSANDLHVRAKELLQTDVASFHYTAPYLTFTAMNIDELLTGGQNFIGQLETKKVADTSRDVSTISFVTERERKLEAQLKQAAADERRLKKQLEQLSANERRLTGELEAAKEKLSREEVELGLLRKRERDTRDELNKTKARENTLGTQFVQLREAERELNVKLKQSTDKQSDTETKLDQMTKSEGELRELLEIATGKEVRTPAQLRLMREHLKSVSRMAKSFSEAEAINGLTLLDNELYVLRKKLKDQVDVYSLKTNNLLRRLSVSGLSEVGMRDMTACKENRCLYISDASSNKCVFRIELQNSGSKWPVDDLPHGLSVTAHSNVLVTCPDARKLREFETFGRQIREITLQLDAVNPWHAIQLSNDQFVVCHGGMDDPANRVCRVTAGGSIVQSYGGPKGPATVGQLNRPYYVAADVDEYIYVADFNNCRVLLLSPTLNFVREVSSRDQLQNLPHILYLDTDSRRLYVACRGGRVVIVSLHASA